MKSLWLDANVVIRLLVQDEPRQSAAATALFHKAERKELNLRLEAMIVAEIIYVLSRLYGHTRIEIANALLALIQNAGVETSDKNLVVDALHRFAETSVDFPDAWLAARACQSDCAIASFDRDFDRFKDVQRVEPRA